MMPRIYQFILSILLAVSAIALAWGIYSGSQPPEELSSSAPVADEAAMEPDEPDQTTSVDIPPPLTDFSEMVARPLFSQTRSPEEPATEATSQLPAKPTGKSRLLVMGIIITEEEKVALLKQDNQQGGDTLKVTEGQEVSGWKVSSITPETVTMSQRDTTDVIKLSDNVLSDTEKRRLAALAKANKSKAGRKSKKPTKAAKTPGSRQRTNKLPVRGQKNTSRGSPVVRRQTTTK